MLHSGAKTLTGRARSRSHLCAVIAADAIEQAGAAKEIAGLGFSAAMHSLVVVDANGKSVDEQHYLG